MMPTRCAPATVGVSRAGRPVWPSYIGSDVDSGPVFVAEEADLSRPEDWFEMLKAEFGRYGEGQAGAPKMMSEDKPCPFQCLSC